MKNISETLWNYSDYKAIAVEYVKHISNVDNVYIKPIYAYLYLNDIRDSEHYLVGINPNTLRSLGSGSGKCSGFDIIIIYSYDFKENKFCIKIVQSIKCINTSQKQLDQKQLDQKQLDQKQLIEINYYNKKEFTYILTNLLYHDYILRFS